MSAGPGPVAVALVLRDGIEESVHLGDVAVSDASGALRFAAGDPDRVVYARSSMKPLQAAVSLRLMGVEPPDDEVAVMCASHNAEPVHLRAVRALLDRAGVPEDALACPAMRPMDPEAAAEAPSLERIHSDCSGKHAGMLAACLAQGWPLQGYRAPDHPLQTAVRAAVDAATDGAVVAQGVDGCGLPVHAMPLRAMATLYARLADPGRLGDLAPHVRRAVVAMRAEPYLVAGRNRIDTALMRTVPGLISKAGAEALRCVAVPDRRLGVALKVRDGGARGADPALVRALDRLGVFGDGVPEALEAFARPSVLGGGAPVGEVRSEFDLEPR